ncbi:sialidase family protein [Terracidiphilus gabretensis]|uniref:sialidase family protein n=1 Tax=Terracidiphilus gabretensis TaxID=1577687 RepID=UPI00071BBB28|nr:sialidase family protein [Terracidiphilus gabretensis]
MSSKIIHLGFVMALCSLAGLYAVRAESAYKLSDGIVRPSAQKGAKEAYLEMIVNSNHAANLLALHNGDLLLTYYSGIYERGADESIVVSRLSKGASKWTTPIVVSHHADWANQNPLLFLAPGGTVWLFHTTQHGDQQKDIVYALKSTDQGHTWSEPTTVFPQLGLYTRQPLVVFQKQWLFPVYHSAGGSITSNAQKDHSYVEVSADSGATWKECDVPGSGGFVQMSIVPLSQDHLIGFFRSRYADWIYKSESSDGCTWTTPQATQLPNNNASIQVTRLKNGRLVMIFNNTQAELKPEHADTGSRRILSIAISEDGGKTWPWIRDLENPSISQPILPLEDAEYSYPSVAQSVDGMIHVAYTFRRQTIKYMTFTEEWIRHGSTMGGKPEDAHHEGVARLNNPTQVKPAAELWALSLGSF